MWKFIKENWEFWLFAVLAITATLIVFTIFLSLEGDFLNMALALFVIIPTMMWFNDRSKNRFGVKVIPPTQSTRRIYREELRGAPTKERFVKFEGDIFKIVETDFGFDAFKFVNNSWERVSGKLIATLDFEGISVEAPEKN